MMTIFKKGVSIRLIIMIVAALGLVAGLFYLQNLEKTRERERAASEAALKARQEEELAAKKEPESKPPATPPVNTTSTPPEAEPPASDEVKFTGTVLAGVSSPLLDFNKADYEAALRTSKLVVLYFYADWCPICAAEIPHLYGAFNELQGDKVVGFRVNFNDGDTDNDEKNLAREYGIAYQHTKVFIKNGRRVLKSPETWEKARYLAEMIKFIE